MWSDQFEITSRQARRRWSRKTMSASDSPEHHLRPALGYAIAAIFKAHLRATFGVLRACPIGFHACHYGRWAGRQFFLHVFLQVALLFLRIAIRADQANAYERQQAERGKDSTHVTSPTS
jgi:hypothetical protein